LDASITESGTASTSGSCDFSACSPEEYGFINTSGTVSDLTPFEGSGTLALGLTPFESSTGTNIAEDFFTGVDFR